MSASPRGAVANGRIVAGDLLGPLRDSNPTDGDGALRRRVEQDGYVLLRSAVPAADIAAARAEVFGRLAAVGEIREPASDGIATGNSARREALEDLGAFWRSVSEGPALRRVTHGAALSAIARALLDAPARGHDYLFLRAAPVGRATGIHCDAPFFTRETTRVITCWIALGPVPVSDGPLFIVEGSHRFADLRDAMRFDLVRDARGRKATVSDDPAAFAAGRGVRLLTADFEPGDCLCFGMDTFHGAFDNHSPIGRARLSCDVRYQPAADPLDPRYFGAEPTGTTGAGYAELNGAKPLTEPWHVR